MAVSIPIDSAEAQRLLGDLGRQLAAFPGELEKAMVYALNRTLKGAATQAVKIITDRYKVKSAEAKRKIGERRASRGRMYIVLQATGRPILLSRFGTRAKNVKVRRKAYSYQRGGNTVQVNPSRPRKYKGVSVQVLKNSQYKQISGGFMGSPRNGVQMIFKRGGSGPSGLKVLRGPSLVTFLARPEVEQTIGDTALERFERDLKHEAGRRLARLLK